MRGAHVLITGISAVAGTCFAAIAGLSISAAAVPYRRFHAGSIVVAVVAILFAVQAFRAALSGKADEETVASSLRRGVVGAIVFLVLLTAALLLFGSNTNGFFAHALGQLASSFTSIRLLIASVLLGFGAGFVVGMPQLAPDRPSQES